MEALSYLQKFVYPVMGKLPGATTEALSANEELELAAEVDFDKIKSLIKNKKSLKTPKIVLD